MSASTAFADRTELDRYLFAAQQLYENLEYERALEQVQKARRQTRSAAEDVRVALWEGLILADLGKRDEALAAFRTALLLDPDAQLPIRVSPKVSRDLSEVRAQVKKELAPVLAKQEAQHKEAERQRADAARGEKAVRRDATPHSPSAAAAESTDARITTALKAPPAPPRAEARGRSLLWPGILGGVAVAAGGGGGWFGLQSRNDAATAALPGFQSDRTAALQSARQNALIANVLFGVAVSSVVGGTLSWVLQPDTAQGTQP